MHSLLTATRIGGPVQFGRQEHKQRKLHRLLGVARRVLVDYQSIDATDKVYLSPWLRMTVLFPADYFPTMQFILSKGTNQLGTTKLSKIHREISSISMVTVTVAISNKAEIQQQSPGRHLAPNRNPRTKFIVQAFHTTNRQIMIDEKPLHPEESHIIWCRHLPIWLLLIMRRHCARRRLCLGRKTLCWRRWTGKRRRVRGIPLIRHFRDRSELIVRA